MRKFFIGLMVCLSLSSCSLTGAQVGATAKSIGIDCAVPAVAQLAAQLFPSLLGLFQSGASQASIDAVGSQAEQTAVGVGEQAALCAEQQIASGTAPQQAPQTGAAVISTPVSTTAKAAAAAHLKAAHPAVKFASR